MLFSLSMLLLALTRAEIVERMKAPVITQADGLIRVFSGCPEDLRREYQMPIASFAAETVKPLYRALGRRPERFARPGIVITVGDVRTNRADVTVSVVTNGSGEVCTRLKVWAPGYADVDRLRTEVVKGFYRRVEGRELSDAEAVSAFRRADPRLRVVDERTKLEDWLGGRGTKDDEEGLRLMRRVFEPGKASKRDVLIFASRLYLYPPLHAVRFLGKYDVLSLRDAVRLARKDPLTCLTAYAKSSDLPVLGGGRSPELKEAADAYRRFLLEFAMGGKKEEELKDLLETAETKLNVAYERAE